MEGLTEKQVTSIASERGKNAYAQILQTMIKSKHLNCN